MASVVHPSTRSFVVVVLRRTEEVHFRSIALDRRSSLGRGFSSLGLWVIVHLFPRAFRCDRRGSSPSRPSSFTFGTHLSCIQDVGVVWALDGFRPIRRHQGDGVGADLQACSAGGALQARHGAAECGSTHVRHGGQASSGHGGGWSDGVTRRRVRRRGSQAADPTEEWMGMGFPFAPSVQTRTQLPFGREVDTGSMGGSIGGKGDLGGEDNGSGVGKDTDHPPTKDPILDGIRKEDDGTWGAERILDGGWRNEGTWNAAETIPSRTDVNKTRPEELRRSKRGGGDPTTVRPEDVDPRRSTSLVRASRRTTVLSSSRFLHR